MKFSEQWLREWVAPKLNTKQLADVLTHAGLEVAAIEPVAASLSHVVVGEIIRCKPHPKSQKLTLCEVSIGRHKTLTIVCGAANARTGLKTAVAQVGATIKGKTIKAAEIQGISSAGMLCSTEELGMSDTADGIIELSSTAKTGQKLKQALALDDYSITLELTPNRGDCLGIAGIAREIAAITKSKQKPFKIKPSPAKTKISFPVKIAAKKECPRYVGRVISGINTDTQTPDWMIERLRRSGVRAIHPVVDVTNYVLLELGQPMHAFDLDKLDHHIEVRMAQGTEKIKLLDEQTIKLDPSKLVIADRNGPVALAGIMGGLASAVSKTTTDIFLESAFFSPEIIAQGARKLGLQSDSSYRFERGVDPQLQRTAILRATELLLTIVGGKPGPIIEKGTPHKAPKPITLRQDRIRRLLGADVPATAVTDTLKRLGMRVTRAGARWRVTPPSHRFDIRIEVDLIEEIARLRGLETLPSRRLRLTAQPKQNSETRIALSKLRDVLIERDYREIITYSFTDPKLQAMFDPDTKALALSNPISADLAVMRTSLWPSLIEVLRRNRNRQQQRVRIFEIGPCFQGRGGEGAEPDRIGGAITGPLWSLQWGAKNRPADFFDVKGDIEALLRLTGRLEEVAFKKATHCALHPGQTAQILLANQPIGWLGTLHPKIQADLDLSESVLLFELDKAVFDSANIPTFTPTSKYPAIRRDLALIIDRGIPAQNVLDCIRSVAGTTLTNVQLFDEYRGEGIDSGRKSLALALTYQDFSRTLKEEEIDQWVAKVIAGLKTELNAELRT